LATAADRRCRTRTVLLPDRGSLGVGSAGLEPIPDGTRLHAEFEPRPHGWFRLIFPIFLQVIRGEEKANMTYLREAVERRVLAPEQR